MGVFYFFPPGYNSAKFKNVEIMQGSSIQKLMLGLMGSGGVEVASSIDIPTTAQVEGVVKIVIQLIIGLVTLIGLFKKKTPTAPK